MDWIKLLDFQPGIVAVCLRLLCAMMVGLIIGTEREYTNRPAGMRTHILVALGACVISITSEALFYQYRDLGGDSDPARLSAQVITGVGFLGAGTIMRDGGSVKGLTTAASLWAVACLGLAAGAGYYLVSLLGMIFIFITLTVFEYIQHKLMHTGGNIKSFTMEATDISQGLSLIDTQSQRYRINVDHIAVQQTDDGYHISFEAEFLGASGKYRYQKFLEALVKASCVTSCTQVNKV